MTDPTPTIHLIFDAHIDPVWLWSWPAGLDAALDTCRTMCELLDTRPDLVFCQDQLWLYDEIRRVDERLFSRIVEHERQGRWHVAGGWWVQPDCNFPSARTLRRQIDLGRDFARAHFRSFPTAGFNVDTFGHPVGLPALLRERGQTRYVMMRPQEHELELPARLFRWRGAPGGAEVLAFRVARGYATFAGELEAHLRASLEGLPDGVDQTMCFVGVGDHGGGPTLEKIEWCDRNRVREGEWRLQVSTPDAFFDSVEARRRALPLVVGELQPHAVGCYSVHRTVKTAVRRAEQRLATAEAIATETDRPTLDAAWADLCVGCFHDVVAGTSIRSSYPQILDRLGRAASAADDLTQRWLRRRVAALARAPLPRLVAWNSAPAPRRAWLEVQVPRLRQRRPLPRGAALLDERGRDLPYQVVAPEAAVDESHAIGLLIPLDLDAGELRVLRIDEDARRPVPAPHSPAIAHEEAPEIRAGDCAVSLAAGRRALRLGALTLALPELALLDDPSDTWSHGIDGFELRDARAPRWEQAQVLERGPLRARLSLRGRVGESRITSTWSVDSDGLEVCWTLDVVWCERHRVLVAEIVAPFDIVERFDGAPGGWATGRPRGAERPMRGFSLLRAAHGPALEVRSRDVFALSGDRRSLRLTLLRSPLAAHHDPLPVRAAPLAQYCDQGAHHFEIIFRENRAADVDAASRRAEVELLDVEVAATTAGVPPP